MITTWSPCRQRDTSVERLWSSYRLGRFEDIAGVIETLFSSLQSSFFA